MANTRSRDFILRLAIEKAVKNGYKLPYIVDLQLEMRNIEELVRYHQVDPANCMDDRWSVMSLNGIIFFHDFAKAFWGERWLPGYGEHEWKTRLKEMVLEEDPIMYLSQFI